MAGPPRPAAEARSVRHSAVGFMRILLLVVFCALSVGCDSQHLLASRGITLTRTVPLTRPTPAQQAAMAATLASCPHSLPVLPPSSARAALKVVQGSLQLAPGLLSLPETDAASEVWAAPDSSIMILMRMGETGGMAGMAIAAHELISEGTLCRRQINDFLAVEARQQWINRAAPHDTIFGALLDVITPGAGALHFTILARGAPQRDSLMSSATTLR